MRVLISAALVAVLALTSACSGVTRLDPTSLGRGMWQRPEDVIAALELTPGARVADLGAGTGYFISYLSYAVGPTGRVYAVDVDAEITDALRLNVNRTNVEVVLGDYDDPKLPEGAIDLVLIVNTYHHIEDRTAYFRSLQRSLKPMGRVAVLEPDADLSGVLSLFVEDGHTSYAGDVVAEMQAAGYRHVASHERLPVQIFEVFEAPGPVSQRAVGRAWRSAARSQTESSLSE